jgi:hypothetical protein
MGETLFVTPAQVLAAKLAIELSEEAGEAPDEALEAIANALVVARQQAAPTQPSTHRDPTVATGTDLGIGSPGDEIEPSGSETAARPRPVTDFGSSSPRPTEKEPNSPASEPPWMRNDRGNNPSQPGSPSPGSLEPRKPQIGTGTSHLPVTQRSGTPEQQKKDDQTIAKHGGQQREAGRDQEEREGPGPGRENPYER